MRTDPISRKQPVRATYAPGAFSKRAVVLFTRVPIAGKSKTRLQSALTPQQCADVQMALICDTMEELSQLDCTVVVAYAPDHEDQENARELFAAFQHNIQTCYNNPCRQLRFIRQEGGTLGQRMDNAFDQVFNLGFHQCLLMGSDIPGVCATELDKLFRKLDRRDVVLCPSQDGGYWLVGLNERFSELFTDKRYGDTNVFKEALQTCTAYGKDFAFGPQKSDIDTPRQLQHYGLRLRTATYTCHHIATVLHELNVLHGAHDVHIAARTIL